METPTPSEATKDHLYATYLERVSLGTGEVIALPGKKSRLGEPFYICARIGPDLYNPKPELRFANIDVFVVRDEKFLPVGIKDYEIHGAIANGNKQRHQHLAATHPAHEAADKYWNTGQGMHVREQDYFDYAGSFERMNQMRAAGLVVEESQWLQQIYQQYGLAKLMIATSAHLLQHHGITEIQFGRLTANAQKSWQTFGYTGQSKISVTELTAHPATKQSIIDFL